MFEIISTGDAYEKYIALCEKTDMRTLTQRAFSDMVSELDVYSLSGPGSFQKEGMDDIERFS